MYCHYKGKKLACKARNETIYETLYEIIMCKMNKFA